MGRRGLLRGAALGSAGLAGAALIGCSSGNNAASTATTAPASTSSVASTQTAGGQSTPATTGTPAAAQPQRGGTFQTVDVGAIDTFDANSGLASTLQFVPWVYSRLLQFNVGDGVDSNGQLEPDLVEKWEQPDETHILLHLRSGVTWDERAPTNGRALDVEDVVSSFDTYAKTGRFRADVVNAATGAGPIKDMTAVDNQTVQIELAFPDSIALPALTWEQNLWIYPKEAWNGGFDPTKDARGSGPFYLSDFRPGVAYTVTRNPKWHFGPDAPYFDAVAVTTIPQQAQWEAQFRAGKIYEGVGPDGDPNIPIVAKEVKGTTIVTAPPPGVGGTVALNWIPGSPHHDVRVRQAMSMSIDRNALIPIFSDPSPYKALGIDIKNYWYNPMSPAYGAYWLDPQGSEFGPAAQYYQHNVAEAKKLLDAAGFNAQNPLLYDITWQPREKRLDTMAATLQAMWADAGIKTNLTKPDYDTEWHGKDGGISAARGYTHWKTGHYMVALKPDSAQCHCLLWLSRVMSSEGSLTVAGDEFPDLTTMIKKARATFDVNSQISQVKDIQRYLGQNMVAPPYDTFGQDTQIYWDGVHGPERYNAYQGFKNTAYRSESAARYWWLDKSLQ